MGWRCFAATAAASRSPSARQRRPPLYSACGPPRARASPACFASSERREIFLVGARDSGPPLGRMGAADCDSGA